MAATAPRNTIERADKEIVHPVAASTKVWQGTIVCLNASGFATKGAVATTLTAVGRAEETIDNSTGANGDLSIKVRRGVFYFKNYGSDPVVRADVGKDCWVYDDETVAHSDGGAARSKAGTVEDVDAGGVWVRFK